MPRRAANTPQNSNQETQGAGIPPIPAGSHVAASPPPGVSFELVAIGDLIPDDRNANKGRPWGMGLLESQIQRNKVGRPILVDQRRKIIAGNKTAETYGQVGGQRVLVVRTRGDVLIAHQREDVAAESEQGREMAVADNRVAQQNLEWDSGVLESLAGEGVDLAAAGISDDELAGIIGAAGEGEVDPNAEWSDMPEFEQQPKAVRTIHIHFTDEADVEQFAAAIGKPITEATRYVWYPNPPAEGDAEPEPDEES